jgi:hypothetical protein
MTVLLSTLALFVIVLVYLLTQWVVGPTYTADGVTPTSNRFGRLNETIIGQVHGKYYEATSRGNVYCVSNGSTGRAPGTALGTSPSILLYNPLGSGKRLKIMKVSMTQASTGTLGTGVLHHCGFTLNGPLASQSNVAPVVGSGASLTPNNMDVGAANSSVAVAFALGTLNANPAILYPFCQLAESVGGTTAVNPNTITEDVDGGIVLEPGAGWCLEAIAAAGSSPLVICGVVWEEIPIG